MQLGRVKGVVTLADLQDPEDYLQLPRLDRREVEYLWMVGLYRSLTWIVSYKGRGCYLLRVPDHALLAQPASHCSRSLVVELTKEQWDLEQEWHRLEQEAAFAHDWSEEERRRSFRRARQVHKANEKRKRDFSGNIVLGWI